MNELFVVGGDGDVDGSVNVQAVEDTAVAVA